MKILGILLLLGLAIVGIYSCNPDNPVDNTLSLLAGTPHASRTPLATPLPADATATAAAIVIGNQVREATIAAENLQASNAEGTAVASRSTAEYNLVRATQLVEQATAVQRDYFMQLTKSVEDANLQSTRISGESTVEVQATVDARAVVVQGWTATGDAQILAGHLETTKLANFATGTSVANDAISTQAAATVVAYAVVKANERTELTNKALAILPFVTYAVVSIIAVVVLALAIPVMLTRLSIISRDKRGDAPIIFDKRGNFFDADRNPYPITTLGKAPTIPDVLPTDMVERHASRDQMIDLQTRGLPGSQLSGKSGKLPQLPATSPSRAIFKVFGSADTPPIAADTVRILDAEWSETK